MVEIRFLPLLEVAHLLPLTPKRIQGLPDIIDVRCGRVGISFSIYPISKWQWQFHIEKTSASLNSLTPWVSRYCREITLPTFHIDFTLF